MSGSTKHSPHQLLMGGSGSTGSSLLKNLLGRHQLIFGSQETSIFAKKEVYHDWQKARKRLTGKRWWGLKNAGFHRYDRIDIFPEEHHLTRTEFKQLLKASNDISALANRFFAPALRTNGKKIWLEKTPANAPLFGDFLTSFPKGFVIHTVRNPLDTIASLVARGFDPFYASAIYLLNTSAGLMSRKSDRYMEVKYEELVRDPEQTLRRICRQLAIPYDDRMLVPNQEQHIATTILPGWQFDEVKKVEAGSIGRFERLSAEDQHLILQAIHHLKVNAEGQTYYRLSLTDIRAVSDQLNYDLPDITPDRRARQQLIRFKRKDQRSRLLHGFPYAFSGYPLDLRTFA